MKRFMIRYAAALLAVMLLLSPALAAEDVTDAVEAALLTEDATDAVEAAPLTDEAPDADAPAPPDEPVPEAPADLDLPSEDVAEDIPSDDTGDIPSDDTGDIPPDDTGVIPSDDTGDIPADDDDILSDEDAPEAAEPEAPEATEPEGLEPEMPEAPEPEMPDMTEPEAPEPEAPEAAEPEGLEPETAEAPESEAAEPEAPEATEPEAPVAEAAALDGTTDPAPEADAAQEAVPGLELGEAQEAPVLAEAAGLPEQLVLGRGERFALSGGEAYASTKPKVASVDASGILRARKRGKTFVTAIVGGAVVGVCTVTVRAAPKRISLPKKQTVMLGQTLLLTPKVRGGASNTITWTSSNPAVAAVDGNGIVSAVGVGKAKITARTYNRKKATCTVTVSSPETPLAVAFPMSLLFVGKGESVALRPVLNPGAVATFTYSSKSDRVVSVTKKGGVAKGKKLNRATTITVKTHNGKKASLIVKVQRAPSAVTMNIPSATMNVSDVIELSALLPAGSASQIAWTSNNPDVAAVSDPNPFTSGDGGSMTVTALSPGSAVITAATYNGLTTSCEIIVNRPHTEKRAENALNLLFIGNSHTYYNDMPLMVQHRANDAGYTCDVTRVTGNGWSLQQHTEDPYLSSTILNGDYDYVILQERVNPMDAEAFLNAARTLNGYIRRTDAVPIIFGCWSKEMEPDKQAELNDANRRVANDIDALLAPVGETWWDYKKAHPEVDLYADDGVHASKAGSDYAAGIIWDTIAARLKKK